FEGLLQFAGQKIVQLTEQIASGEINARPYRLNQTSPCSYCKYKSVCRFDWQINDYNLLEPLNKLQVLERMGGGDG
ncbi:MAG: PD-(D/E)XK nuclease family protein, partial [Planctomycetota bacterium]